MKLLLLLIKNITKIHKIKFHFTLPKKNKILIFDRERLFFLEKLITKKKIHSLDIRLESLNLPILFKSILKNGFKELSKEYIKNYIIAVKPKIILTFSDYNPTFFLLKDIVTEFKFKTIAVQSSFRTNTNIHFGSFKKVKEKLRCDYFFVFSDESKKLFLRYIYSKYIINGSFMNNSKKIINYKNKKKKILLISQFKVPDYNIAKWFFMEKKLVIFLKKYCDENNFLFNIAVRSNITTDILNFESNLKTYLKYFKDINKKNIIGETLKKNNYNNVDGSDLVIFLNSTLGLEALARGKKVLSFPHFPICKNQYKEFFIEKLSKYSVFKKKMNLMISINRKNWNKKTQQSKLKYFYDSNNSKFRNLFNKITN
jgi:surface carbohydrate biosynthesis protein